MKFRNSQHAFEKAIKNGLLSALPTDSNFAGKFMYMHTEDDGRDAFKHIDTRQYIRAAPMRPLDPMTNWPMR